MFSVLVSIFLWNWLTKNSSFKDTVKFGEYLPMSSTFGSKKRQTNTHLCWQCCLVSFSNKVKNGNYLDGFDSSCWDLWYCMAWVSVLKKTWPDSSFFTPLKFHLFQILLSSFHCYRPVNKEQDSSVSSGKHSMLNILNPPEKCLLTALRDSVKILRHFNKLHINM